jgi:hydrogenase nickel incorporation protein HypA/HybF
MHEFSISTEIVKSVLNTAEENNGKRIVSVQLEIGESTHINPEQVAFWIRELFKGSMGEKAEVTIRTVKTQVKCKTCGYRGGLTSDRKGSFHYPSLQVCPKCRGFQITVEKGQECLLRRIQVIR